MNAKRMLCQSSSGFTLIELVIVVAIVGILANIAMLQVGTLAAKARDARRKSDLRGIAQVVGIYYSEHGTYAIPAGYYGDGSGYFNFNGEGAPSASDYLYQHGYIRRNNEFIEPVGASPAIWGNDYFYSVCDTGGGSFEIYANLEFPTAAETNKVLNTTCISPIWGDAYYRTFYNYAYP